MKPRTLYTIGLVTALVAIVGLTLLSIERKLPDATTDSVKSPEQAVVTLDESSAADMSASDPGIPYDYADEIDLRTAPNLHDSVVLDFSHVTCATMFGGLVAAGTDGGVVLYSPADSVTQIVSVGQGLVDHRVTCLLAHNNSLYIGTKSGLFLRDETGDAAPIIPELQSEITAIAMSGDTLLIGTATDGLIRVTYDETAVALDVDSITAIESALGLIWVATSGNGLFSYDGGTFRERYLDCDTLALDYVTSLGSKFGRLYAGTPLGLWVFDGGRWRLRDARNGLFVSNITDVAFRGWQIVVGTNDWGCFALYEDAITPLAWTEAIEVTAVAADGDMIAVGTTDRGLLVYDGKGVANVNPQQKAVELPQLTLLM
jgi:hypothetical protein